MTVTRGAPKGKKPPARAVKSASRARAIPDPAKAKTVEDRVQHIMAIMERGLWATFRIRDLAAVWDISMRRVRDHSAEASRRIAEGQLPVDKAKLRAGLTDLLQAWAAENAEEGDHKSATRQIELVAKLQGLIVHQHEHQFQQEFQRLLEVARAVLPKEWFRKLAAALVAEAKGEVWAPMDEKT